MADKIVIEGVGRHVDGEYEFDATEFTMGDYKILKDVAGIRAGEVVDALRAGDVTLVVALAVIATKQPAGLFWSAKAGKVRLVLDDGDEAEDDEQGDDAGPPAVPKPPEPESGGNSTPDESTTSSGETSAASSENQETRLRAIGQ